MCHTEFFLLYPYLPGIGESIVRDWGRKLPTTGHKVYHGEATHVTKMKLEQLRILPRFFIFHFVELNAQLYQFAPSKEGPPPPESSEPLRPAASSLSNEGRYFRKFMVLLETNRHLAHAFFILADNRECIFVRQHLTITSKKHILEECTCFPKSGH